MNSIFLGHDLTLGLSSIEPILQPVSLATTFAQDKNHVFKFSESNTF